MTRFPNEDRRRLLMGMAGVTLASAGGALPASAVAEPADAFLVGGQIDWSRLRQLFPLRDGLVHLNSANLAPPARRALKTGQEALLDIAQDPSFENRLKYDELIEAARLGLAGMLGASPDEIAITRNTSEGNRTVIAGLDLGPDDEVVVWDQNHESNNVAWDVWSRRYGFKVVRVTTPVGATQPERLLSRFVEKFSSRTRLLAFSHVSNLTGVALPAHALCQAARSAGIRTLVDGAQSFGVLDLDLPALGCDFFTGSGHKWLCGPLETGVLFVRKERVGELWPSMVTHGWDVQEGAGARKFDCLGQRDPGRILGLAAAVELQEELGRSAIERRVRFLVAELRAKLQGAGIDTFVTPKAEDASAGILTFRIAAPDPFAVMGVFYRRFNVSALATPLEKGSLIRFAPNVYNTEADIDTAVAATVASLS